jgi:hypothetical protein
VYSKKKKTKVDTVMDGKTLFLHINPSLAAYQMIRKRVLYGRLIFGSYIVLSHGTFNSAAEDCLLFCNIMNMLPD